MTPGRMPYLGSPKGKIEFNYTHQELTNKQIEDKYNFLKNEISSLNKHYIQREKDWQEAINESVKA